LRSGRLQPFDDDIRTACAADPQDAAFDPQMFYMPQTPDTQEAVEKARQAQVAAVEAFAAYAVAKVGKDPSATVQQKQAAVITYLEQLPTLVNAVRGLMGKSPASAVHDRPDASDPVRAIAALRPKMEFGRRQSSRDRKSFYPKSFYSDRMEVNLGQ
jgi:hypothetical protein